MFKPLPPVPPKETWLELGYGDPDSSSETVSSSELIKPCWPGPQKAPDLRVWGVSYLLEQFKRVMWERGLKYWWGSRF